GAGLAGGVDVQTSADGGATWAEHDLPIDLDAIAGDGRPVWISGTSVASTGSGIVATLRIGTEVDASVLPPGQAAPHGVRATPAGVDVMGDVVEGQPMFSSQCVGGTVVVLTDAQRASMGE